MAFLKLSEDQLRVMESKELVSSSFMYPNGQILSLIAEVRESRKRVAEWAARAKDLRKDPAYTDCAVTLESCVKDLSE